MSSLITNAINAEKNGRYLEAIDIYLKLNLLMKNNAFDINIRLIGRSILKENPSLVRGFFSKIGIDNVYVINLNKRDERRILVEQEMKRYGVNYQIFSAIDGSLCSEAINYYHRYMSEGIKETIYSSHLSVNDHLNIKNHINIGAFGYMMTQIKIFENALKNRYERICVFDDDVFFSDLISLQLKNIIASGFCEEEWRVLLLGASEYSEVHPGNTIGKGYDFYNPISGKTCGSFANCYDSSIFEEILSAIREMNGVFDNTVLGYVYNKYPNECFAIYPSVCFADVATSNIRRNRDQFKHAKLMHWPITKLRYLEYKNKL